jgi:hypothetical protein
LLFIVGFVFMNGLLHQDSTASNPRDT